MIAAMPFRHISGHESKEEEKKFSSYLIYFPYIDVVDTTGMAIKLIDKVIRVEGPLHFDVIHNERYSL